MNIEEVYEGFAQEVKKLIPFDKISINIVDFENSKVAVAYVTGKAVAGRNVKDIFPLAGSFTEEVIKKGKGIIFHPANEEEVAAQLAQMGMEEDSPLREKFSIILEATDRSANLARQLLAFSRKQVMEMKVMDILSPPPSSLAYRPFFTHPAPPLPSLQDPPR